MISSFLVFTHVKTEVIFGFYVGITFFADATKDNTTEDDRQLALEIRLYIDDNSIHTPIAIGGQSVERMTAHGFSCDNLYY